MANRANELRAERAKLIEDARALVSAENVTDEQSAKFDEMMAAADKLKGQIDRIEKAERLEAENLEAARVEAHRRGVSSDQVLDEKVKEDAAFNAYLRVGMNRLTDEQREIANARFRNAQSEGTNSEGGYTVPTGFYQKLTDAQKAYGGMINVSTVINTTTGNSLPVPTDNDTTNTGAILAENTQAASTGADVSFGVVTLGAYTYTSKIVLVSNQLLQDSAFDLNTFLAGKLGVRIARAVNAHLTTGDGSSKPTGVVTAAQSGATTASGQVSALTWDDFVALEHSVDPAYRPGAKWMMSDDALKAAKLIKDGYGRPIWLPGVATNSPDTILGYGYQVNQDMDTVAAGHKPIVFGDLKSYFIRQVAGAVVLRMVERYADYNQVGFVAFQRWDGNLIDAGTHPVKYLTMAAS